VRTSSSARRVALRRDGDAPSRRVRPVL
jgi:hypothetical protein